ncbi:D-tyrosyl-tRNA(Tyr) deacylase [Neisseria meningitidis]|nr:D-tyrosyl-tRNA(Tyr) deacylase [Neisseria meningitidis]
MRAVIQKTVGAKVDVVSENGTETCGKIDGGFVVLLGVTHSDIEKDARYVADKIAHLRVFEDGEGKLNLSLKDVGDPCCWCRSLRFMPMRQAAGGRHFRKPHLQNRQNGFICIRQNCCAGTGFMSKQGVSARICRCRSATTGR